MPDFGFVTIDRFCELKGLSIHTARKVLSTNPYVREGFHKRKNGGRWLVHYERTDKLMEEGRWMVN